VDDLKQALLNFRGHATQAMPRHFQNINILRRYFKTEPNCPLLLYVLPRAVANVLDKMVLETSQAWRMMNRLLRAAGEPELSDNDNRYKDLNRIRDKIVAHRVEVYVATSKHWDWFRSNYGRSPDIDKLIQQVALRIAAKVDELEERGIIDGFEYSVMPPELRDEQVREFVELLSKGGLL
jgi:hypothetical protein